MTDPSPNANALDDLPADLAQLCRIVQGTTLHLFWSKQYGVALTGERREEVHLRSMENRLARMFELDPRLLTEARPPGRRLVGNCRDFSLMLVSLLRYQGSRFGHAAASAPISSPTGSRTTGSRVLERRVEMLAAGGRATGRAAARGPEDPLRPARRDARPVHRGREGLADVPQRQRLSLIVSCIIATWCRSLAIPTVCAGMPGWRCRKMSFPSSLGNGEATP
jgi:hypothetical protein